MAEIVSHQKLQECFLHVVNKISYILTRFKNLPGAGTIPGSRGPPGAPGDPPRATGHFDFE